jgi:uncharacterized membrane protein
MFVHVMRRFNLILSVAILISAIILVFSKIFTPQPIQILLQTGQEVTTQTPNYYELPQVLLLVASSFLIGMTATYLFFASKEQEPRSSRKEYATVLHLLKGDERLVFSVLHEHNGEMVQSALVEKLGLSKVSITRALMKLEQKNLIVKERYGLTNKVKLKLE